MLGVACAAFTVRIKNNVYYIDSLTNIIRLANGIFGIDRSFLDVVKNKTTDIHKC